MQARSNKAAFSFLKDTEKVVDLGDGLEVHVERINSNIGRLYFAAAKQMPLIIVREPNTERLLPSLKCIPWCAVCKAANRSRDVLTKTSIPASLQTLYNIPDNIECILPFHPQ